MKYPLSQLIIASVACTAAFIGYGMWYAALSAKSTAVSALQSAIESKTETVNRIAATRATLAGISNDEEVVQSYFVPETGVVGFIDSLESRGKALKASVNVLSVSSGDTAARPSLSLSITIKGTFDAVMRTIGSIEYAPYDISISSLGMAQDTKNAWHADLKLLVGSRAADATTNTP